MLEGVGCCSMCARVCHRDHDVTYSKHGSFFCDCGAKEDGSCIALTPRLPLTSEVDSSSKRKGGQYYDNVRQKNRRPVPGRRLWRVSREVSRCRDTVSSWPGSSSPTDTSCWTVWPPTTASRPCLVPGASPGVWDPSRCTAGGHVTTGGTGLIMSIITTLMLTEASLFICFRAEVANFDLKSTTMPINGRYRA